MNTSVTYDLLIRGGTVIDGTKAPRFDADVGIKDGRIAAVGDLAGARAARTIDAAGLIVAPGFIDSHTHDDQALIARPDMDFKVSQGVTTVIAGNCGISAAPLVRGMKLPMPLDLIDDPHFERHETFASWVQALEAKPAATNVAALVGHSTLRAAAMADLDRVATPEEIAKMQALLVEALDAGAIGLSTGTFYPPAVKASTEEIIEIGRPLSARQGLYVTHMRDESSKVMEALDETFRIGRELGIPVVISHHKVVGKPNHGRSAETLPLIERAMRSQKVGLDCYPYCASSTILSYDRTLIASKTLVTWSTPHPEFSGSDLQEISKKMGKGVEETVKALLPAGAIYFSMDEKDVQRILGFEHTMIGSDGLPHDGMPHPRLWGTFPRVLGHYCRDLKIFSLEEAVHKMTGLTAKTFGLADRGLLKEGYAADLVLFDAAEVDEAASFEKPKEAARGIDTVIVNGQPVWRGGKPTGARPGQVLRRTP